MSAPEIRGHLPVIIPPIDQYTKALQLKSTKKNFNKITSYKKWPSFLQRVANRLNSMVEIQKN